MLNKFIGQKNEQLGEKNGRTEQINGLGDFINWFVVRSNGVIFRDDGKVMITKTVFITACFIASGLSMLISWWHERDKS